MNKIIANFSGKLDVEIFRENKESYYDYKISDHSNKISCFVYGQPLEKVDQVVKALENINFAQMEKVESQQEESEIKKEIIGDEETKLSENEVTESRDQNKTKINGRAKKLSKEDISDINEMYDEGELIDNLADLYGVTNACIRYHLRKNKGFVNKIKKSPLSKRVTKEDEQKMFIYKRKGLSFTEIGENLGFSRDAVSDHIKNPRFLNDFDIFVINNTEETA